MEPHTWGIAIGEFNTLGRERLSDVGKRAGVGGTGAALEVGQGLFGDACAFGELFLRPIEQGTPGAALFGTEGGFIFFHNVMILDWH
jgi:hypothetical protein